MQKKITLNIKDKLLKTFKIKHILLPLSLLLLSQSPIQTTEVNAITDAQSNALIDKYARRGTNDYTIDGEFNYESYMSKNNETYNSTYYESGKGKWSDAKPKNVGSSFYRPDDGPVGDIDMGNASDWGFSPTTAVWAGSLLHNHGRPNRTSVDYMRLVRQTYQRMKTTPVLKTVTVSGHAYKSGTNYWIKPNGTVQVKIFNTQSFNGTKFQLDDYIKNNNLRLYNSGVDARASMDFSGSTNYFKTNTELDITKNTVSRANGNRDLNTTFNVKAKVAGKAYQIHNLATSKNGKEVGYTASGSYLKTDGTAPTGSLSPNSSTWTNSNVTVSFNPSDSESGVKRWRWRTSADNGSNYGGWSAYIDGDTTSNITVSATASNKLQVQIEDNVGNVGTVTSGTYQVDKTAPGGTITGNPTAWTNKDVTLSVAATDTGGSGVKSIKKPDGTTVTGSTLSLVVGANSTQNFVVTDNAGNTKTISASVTKIDKTLPTLTVSASTTAWTNSSVTLTATGADTGGAGVKSITLPNGTVVTSATGSQTVTANGTYTFKVTDNAGNVTSKAITVSNFDKTAPTGTATGNPTAWTNANATLTFTATDTGGSGVKSIKKPDGTTVTTASTTYVVSANGTYNFVVTDNVGNVSTVPIVVTKIDKTLPTLSIVQTPTTWTNGNVTLTATGADTGGSGVKSITLPNGTVVTGATGSQAVSANGTYTFKITDNVGNVTSKAITVTNIDKTVPGGTVTGNPTAWTNANVTLTINATDTGGAGVKSIKKPDGTTVTTTSTTHVVTANGTYDFIVTDNAGNTKTISVVVNRIDKALPTITIVQTPTTWTNGNVSLNATGADTGGAGVKSITLPNGTVVTGSTGSQIVSTNGTYTFKVTDNAGNVTSKAITVTNIDKALPSGTITGNPTAWTNANASLTINATDTGGAGVKSITKPDGTVVNATTTTYVATANGTYNFVVTDNAGNTKTVSVIVTMIDKTVPSGNIAGNPTVWTNANATLTITAADTGGSGFKSITKPDGTVVTTATTTYVVSANGTYNFVITDNAGNKTTVSASVTKIDKLVPGGSATGNPTVWTNANATLTFTASDTGGSGVKSIKKPDGTTVTTASTTFLVSTNGTYNFVVTDNAGNSKTVSIVVNRIDKSLPTLTIVQTPTAWTKSDVTLTATGSDTGGSGVKSITLPNGNIVSGSSASQVISANGTFTFKVTDNAGNVASKAITVTNIDKVAPTVGKTEVKNVTQDSFDVYLYDVKDLASGISKVQFPVWTNEGGQDDLLKTWQTDSKASGTNMGNGTWKFTVNRSEHNYEFGYYTVHIYTYDAAGNTAVTTTSYELRDQVKPTIEVTGNPTTWIGNDIVLTVKGSDVHTGVKSITLPDGTVVVKNGAKGATVSHTYTITKNGSYTFTVTDMYGNTASQTVVVNKIDKTVPNGTVTPSTTAWTNKDVTLTIDATDSESGIKNIKLPSNAVVSGVKTTFIVTKNGTYSFVLTDNVGNVKTISTTISNIDKVIPTEGTVQIQK